MSKPGLFWHGFELPAVVSPTAARATLLGLASLAGQPRLVLEAIASGGRVAWRIGGDETAVRKAARLIQTHLPGTLVIPPFSDPADSRVSLAGQLSLTGSKQLPLNEINVEHVARGFLGVCAGTGQSEELRLQLVLGVRLRPSHVTNVDGVVNRAVAAKHAQYGFGCCLRLAACSGHEARARQLMGDAASALRGVEAPGLALRLRHVSPRTFATARSPFFWPLWLSITDLVPLLGWPISSVPNAELPAVAKRHPRLLPATRQLASRGRTIGLATLDQRAGRTRSVAQRPSDTLQHTHVMGLTGTGKSTLLAQMVLSDAAVGQGAVVVDPKGDLVDDLLARLPEDRLEDVIVLDPRDAHAVGINPLMGSDPDLAADGVLAVFHSLYRDAWGPRTSDLLHGSLLTLARRGDASLIMVPLLLTNLGFRRSVIGPVVKADPLGLGSFWATFNAWSDVEREHNIQPLLNKLRQVLLRPALRAVFGQRRPRFDIRDVFTKQRLLLVSLGKGTIGPEAAQLLGSIFVSHLWQAITQRVATSPTERTPVQVYVDELQDYLRLPTDLGDALAQSRGLGVGFTLSHQELGQLGQLRSAVLANTRSRVYFQVAPSDAREIASAFGDGVLERDDFRALPAFRAYGQLLTAGTTAPWVSLGPQPLSRPVRQPDTVRARSAARYGQRLDDVEADLLHTLGQPAKPTSLNPSTSTSAEPLGRRRPDASQANGREQP